MVVTLTAAMLRARLQLASAVPDAEVEQLLAAASAMIDRYAPNAPEAIANEGVFRVAAWLNISPTPATVTVDGDLRIDANANSYHSAMRRSGAQDILAPWRAVSVSEAL